MASRDQVTYREWAPPVALRPWLRCVWLRASPTKGETVRVLPDACADLMWIDGTLEIAGPDTTVNPAVRPAGGRIVGVRFRPGMVAPVLGVNAAQLTDLRVDLADLWARDGVRLRERMGEAPSTSAIAGELLRTVAARVTRGPPPDRIIEALARACHELQGPLAVRDLAAALGVSERQLRRRSLAAFGYGPRTLDRIMRFQRFLRLAEGAPSGYLAVIAADAGYADQAHLSRECRRLAGRPPAALLADRAA